MLPVPRPGVLRAVEGRAEALAVPGITGLTITIPPGQRVRPLPDGDRYLGFIFASGGTPADVDHKRAAILAHASQVGPDDVPQETFAAAYGYEWYRRTGGPGVLDHLGNAHLVAV